GFEKPAADRAGRLIADREESGESDLSKHDKGLGEAGGGKNLSSFDMAPTVTIRMGDDVANCRNMIKPHLALYIGGMGAREKKFYFNIACRHGYEEAANKNQDLYLAGQKMEAGVGVPPRIVYE